MKKMFFSMAAMAALCLITACGDETSADPTRAELCQGGLSFDCLADGTWQMDGATEVTEIGGDTLRTIYKDHNFGATPAKLTFKGDGSFTFTYPPQSAMLASCRENTTTGTWSVSGKTLSIKDKNRQHLLRCQELFRCGLHPQCGWSNRAGPQRNLLLEFRNGKLRRRRKGDYDRSIPHQRTVTKRNRTCRHPPCGGCLFL